MKPKSISRSISIYLTYAAYGSQRSPSNMVTNFAVPIDLFGYPASEFNCFSGFTWIDLLLGMGPITSKLIISGLDITNTINQADIRGIVIVVMCYGQCPPSYFILTDPSTCLKCSNYIPYC